MVRQLQCIFSVSLNRSFPTQLRLSFLVACCNFNKEDMPLVTGILEIWFARQEGWEACLKISFLAKGKYPAFQCPVHS